MSNIPQDQTPFPPDFFVRGDESTDAGFYAFPRYVTHIDEGYYEVDLGSDTQCFRPTHYVDVTTTEPRKREACMAHRSQNPEGFYTRDHVPMLRFRSAEAGCGLAEAFIRQR